MAPGLGRPVVAENRPGAGGMLAAANVARSQAKRSFAPGA
jgi:tripartite-type tricarboxylate transporter receptor subunit TctC